jgi:hypothetical protein
VSEPLTPLEFGRLVRDMNERIRQRRDALQDGVPVPIYPPKWADSVWDTGREVIAIHADTYEPHPLDVHEDLTPEDHAVVVIRRVALAGGTREEIERLITAFGLDATTARRLVRQLKDEMPS